MAGRLGYAWSIDHVVWNRIERGFCTTSRMQALPLVDHVKLKLQGLDFLNFLTARIDGISNSAVDMR